MNALPITNMFPNEIVCCSDDMLESATACSEFLNIPLVTQVSQPQYLMFDAGHISVHSKQHKQALTFIHSFSASDLKRRVQSQDQHLLKAFKDKQKAITSILDLTAGWCRDSFILAHNNYQVSAVEQSNLIYFLTHFSLKRYQEQNALSLTLHHSNALHYLSSLQSLPNAIYLDPMFPATSQQAKNKKEIQLLQAITQNNNMEELFQLALKKATQRVVVKRPLHSDFLNALKPNFQFKGKTIRFDVYQCF